MTCWVELRSCPKLQLLALHMAADLQLKNLLRFVLPLPLPASCHVPVRRLQEARCPHSSVLIEESRLSCPLPAASLFLLFSVSTTDEAQEAEAIQILTSVLNIRESTSDKAPRKTIFVLKILVMLYYLMMNYSKASFPRKAVCLKWR